MSDGGPAQMVKDPIPVAQMDREAAAYIGERFANWTEQQARITREGRGDQYPIVQAFARHRIEVLNAADAAARTNQDFKTVFKTAPADAEESQ